MRAVVSGAAALEDGLDGDDGVLVERVVASQPVDMLVPPVPAGIADLKGTRAGGGEPRDGARDGNSRGARRAGAEDAVGGIAAALEPLIAEGDPEAPQPAVAEPGGVEIGLLRAPLAGDFEGAFGDRPGQNIDDAAHGVAAGEGAERAAGHLDAVDFADGHGGPVELAGVAIVEGLAVEQDEGARLRRSAAGDAPHADAGLGVLEAFAAIGINPLDQVQALVQKLLAANAELLAGYDADGYGALLRFHGGTGGRHHNAGLGGFRPRAGFRALGRGQVPEEDHETRYRSTCASFVLRFVSPARVGVYSGTTI